MQVFEFRCRIKLKKDILLEQCNNAIAVYIDSALALNENMLELHKNQDYKFYAFDSFYPIEKEQVYKKGKIYTVRIRTVKKDLASYFAGTLAFHETTLMKGCGGEIKLIPQKEIHEIYSITPVIIKNDYGYWKNNMSLEEYEKRIRDNLIKKYNALFDTCIKEDFMLYDLIEFKNKVPVKLHYKDITLLGDKLHLYIASNPTAQALAYLALGTGLGENSSACGAGFVNWK